MTTSKSHLVIARKWRPDRFEDLVGQEHVTRTLAQALSSGRIAHAFLFSGIRGVGKTTAARILARCLNCERGPTPTPCGECAACVEIREGRSLDVVEIDGATYRKIDDARAIIENLSYRPARDRFKIYIIDEAHQLTDQAFNALLKTLEEPPPHVKFILATTEPQKMPETILSRLQRYDFRRIPLATIVERLSELARREEFEVEEAAIRLLAREAGGSMRDAERMLETALASLDGKVTEAEVAASLGVAGRTAVLALAEAILDKNAASALRAVREQSARGANLESLGRDLLETIRNLAVARLPETGGTTPLTDLPDHEASELKRLAAKASSRDLMRLFKLMADSQEQIARSSYPDLLLEMAVVRMATLAPVMDAEELLRALGAAAGPGPAVAGKNAGRTPGGSSGGSSGIATVIDGSAANAADPPITGRADTRGASASPTGTRRIRVEGEVKADAPRRVGLDLAPKVAPTIVGSAIASEGVSAAADASAGTRGPIGSDLADLRAHIRSKRAALAGFMEQGAALTLDGDKLLVLARKDIYLRYLSDNRGAIADLAAELYGRRLRVDVILEGAPASPAPSEPLSADAAETPSAMPNTAAPAVATPSVVEPSLSIVASAAAKVTSELPTADAGTAAPSAAASSADRQAIYADPVVRRIFDEFQARVVDVRERPAPVSRVSAEKIEETAAPAGGLSEE